MERRTPNGDRDPADYLPLNAYLRRHHLGAWIRVKDEWSSTSVSGKRMPLRQRYRGADCREVRPLVRRRTVQDMAQGASPLLPQTRPMILKIARMKAFSRLSISPEGWKADWLRR